VEITAITVKINDLREFAFAVAVAMADRLQNVKEQAQERHTMPF
jgi:hypothetical protein